MQFRDTPEQASWRQQVRQFIAENLPADIRGVTGYFYDPRTNPGFAAWRDALAKRGWIAPAWPREYGGAGLGVVEQFILNQEFAEAGAPQPGGLGVMMLGPTLITHGTEEQKREHLPRILSGEVLWCQGYSEPGAGSDLAALQTRAVRDGDDYIINGQKIWTSFAHFADWCFLLARTNPDAPKHRGLTYFLVDMKSPGITDRPLVNMAGGHDFNEVFFEDVRVPARNIVGEVDRGWYVGATTLDFERSSIGTAVGQRKSIERYVAWLRDHRHALPPATAAASRLAWADRAVEVQVLTLLAYRIISMQAAGMIPNAEASIAKLFSSETGQRIAATALRMLGTAGALTDRSAPFKGEVARSYLNAVSLTIAGGTSEIQRNIIAQRGLGLPRG
jgi:alkylation response protein AidB-like acyl-CoA dehydrogenase